MKKYPYHSIYERVTRFTEITKTLICEGKISRVKTCLTIADKLMRTGSNEMKQVIANVFVFSVTSFLEFRKDSRVILELLPATLKAEYHEHINTTGA